MYACCAAWPGRVDVLGLWSAVGLVGAYLEGVASLLEGPVVSPDHPRRVRERLAQLRLEPLSLVLVFVVDADFDLGYTPGSSVGDSADGYQLLSPSSMTASMPTVSMTAVVCICATSSQSRSTQ